MKLKTHTFYTDKNGKNKSDLRKLKPATLERWEVESYYYASIDLYALSRGYFDRTRTVHFKKD